MDSNPPEKDDLCKVFTNMREIETRNKLNILNVLERQRLTRIAWTVPSRVERKMDSTCEPGRDAEANYHKKNSIQQLKNNKLQ